MINKLMLFYMGIISTINTIIVLPLILLGIFLNKMNKYYNIPYFEHTHKIYTIYANIFLSGISGILKYFYGTEIFVENIKLLDELIDSNRSSGNIIVQNHQTEFDYLFGYALLIKNMKLNYHNLKMIMGYHVYVMLAGIGLISILSNSILIRYNRNKDEHDIKLCEIKKNDIVYLFPEGCVYNKNNKEKSDKYCDKNNIEKTKNCLYPKTGALEILNINNNINHIYSFCTQYDSILPCDKNHTLFNTKMPKQVYIKIEKHTVDNTIQETTIDVFRKMDKYMDKNINIDNYVKIDNTYSELFYLFIFLFIFAVGCYSLVQYNFVRYYFISVLAIYYIYLYMVI
jgi:hypothetical protein